MRGAAASAVGIAVGIVLALALVLARARRPEPRAAGPAVAKSAIVSDDAGPLAEVLVHWVPELAPSFAPTYRDFLATLPRETRVLVVIPRGKRGALDAFLRGVDPEGALAARVTAIEIDEPLGMWSKDRALVLAPAEGEAPTLLVPPRPRAGEGSRPRDWDIVPAVAKAVPDRVRVRQLPIAFDGGDFTIAGSRVLFDVNLFTRNKGRGARSPAELRERVRELLGREVVMLGEREGDVPRHHMSMYMAALDGGTALVGDPAAGSRIVGESFAPGEAAVETGEPLRADFSRETIARFDRAAADLAAAGFRVVRVPTVPFDDRTYFAYTNAVFETRGGAKRVWMPAYGVPALDAAAMSVYEALGWKVTPVSVRGIYMHHGTIGCLVNVLRRG